MRPACQTVRMLRLALILLLLPVTLAQAQPERERLVGISDLCDSLLSADAALRDRAIIELGLLTAPRAEELGRELLTRPALEACKALGLIGTSTGPFIGACAAACLDSNDAALRNAALQVLLDAPLGAMRRGGEAFIRGKRLERLKTMLTDAESLRPICESLPEVKELPRAPVERSLRLAILADRHLGSPGFIGLLRALAQLMVGHEEAVPKAEAEGAEPEANAAEDAQVAAQAERLRRQAAALFEAIWIAPPGAQFNYVPGAPLADRSAAVARLSARLAEMEIREVSLGSSKFRGVRLGDYLLEVLASDVTDIAAAGYLRLRWWKGEELPLEGDDYSRTVDELNAMGKRERAQLRNDLRRWWESWRNETEPK